MVNFPVLPPPPDFGISFANGGPGVGGTWKRGAPKVRSRQWDRDRTVREFGASVISKDRDDLETAMKAMNRLRCWRACIAQFVDGRPSEVAIGHALLCFWRVYGLLSIPRGLKKALPIFVDALRYHLPAYSGLGLTLYRGELEARHLTGNYGIAWTRDLETARMFASRRVPLKEGNGIVLRIEAASESIVVDFPSYVEIMMAEEHEYIVDPRLIPSVEVMETYAAEIQDREG